MPEPSDGYRLLLPLAGELEVRPGGRVVRVGPGAASLIARSVPYAPAQGGARPVEAVVLPIPARELYGRLGRPAPLTAGIDVQAGAGRVMRDMAVGLFEERDRLTRVQFDAIRDRLVELLCLLVAGAERPCATGRLPRLEAAVRRYAREHADDPGLSGATMARDLGWSLRQIQLALQRAGTTPRDLIREERLRAVRDRLRNPADDHLTIAELAFAYGFSSAGALSTAFRRRYGITPRALRRAGGGSAFSDGDGTADRTGGDDGGRAG